MTSKIYWKTADQKLIDIKDMNEIHLINTIRCLQGLGRQKIPDPWHHKSKSEWIDILTNELNSRRKNK